MPKDQHRKSVTKKLFQIIIIIVCILLYGTLGYMIVMRWGFLDSLYMTAITFTTVGFGEVQTLNQAGRIFTLTLLLCGVATFGYGISSLTGIIVEGQIKDIFRIKKMQKTIDNLVDHVIVCGYDHLGNEACNELEKWKQPYVIIEKEENVYKRVKDENKLILFGDATDDKILIKAGIKNAKGLLSCLTSDADNLFVTLTARSLNPNLTIVSKTVNYSSEAKLLSAGADKVISPIQIGGVRMASILINPDVVSFIDVVVNAKEFDLSIQSVKVIPGSQLDGVAIKDSNIPKQIKVIGLKQEGIKMLVNPASSVKIQGNDVLIVLGENVEITRLYNMAQSV